MDVECPKCGALHWACERLNKSTIARPIFGTCCLDGKVKIPKLLKPPRELLELYNGTNFHSKHFLAYITSYNNAFAMVSLSHNCSFAWRSSIFYNYWRIKTSVRLSFARTWTNSNICPSIFSVQ